MLRSEARILTLAIFLVTSALVLPSHSLGADEPEPAGPPAAEPAREQEEVPVPFAMPVLEGWRTETIPFPLGFAPGLPYEGLEELRFAPGMFEAEEEDFWSYAFVWWVHPDGPTAPESLGVHLTSYFTGLADAVAESRELEIEGATFSSEIRPGEGSSFEGTAETMDVFVTLETITLNIKGDVVPCPDQGRTAVWFLLSPQPYDHAVWKSLASIREGFACENGDAD